MDFVSLIIQNWVWYMTVNTFAREKRSSEDSEQTTRLDVVLNLQTLKNPKPADHFSENLKGTVSHKISIDYKLKS